MSHPPFNTTLDLRPAGFSIGVRELKQSDGSWKESARWTRPLPQLGGFVKHRKLAGSTKNLPNATGWRSPAPYSGAKYEVEYTSPELIRSFPSGYRDHILVGANPYNMGVPSSLSTSALIAELRQKCLQKFREKKVDLSTAYLERKKTATLGADAADHVRGLWQSLRSRNPRKTLDELGDLWLGYRYGWTPALMDVYGACETLQRLDNGTYERHRVSTFAKGQLVKNTSTSRVTQIYGGSLSVPALLLESSRVVTSVKVRMDADMANSTAVKLADVGVTDPASTLWESLPYSFVVDWFAGVGNYLEGVNALDGYKFRSECITVHNKWDAECKFGDYDRTTVIGSRRPIRGRGESFTRTVGFLPPLSRIIISRPPVDLVRLTDSIALLRNAMRR